MTGAGATIIANWILISGFVIGAAGAGLMLFTRRRAQPATVTPARDAPPKLAAAPVTTPVSFSTDTLDAAIDASLKHAFGVEYLDAHLSNVDLQILERVASVLEHGTLSRDYLPRRPMLLPKLMQMLNDAETSRDELVRTIMQDPALAGGVLQQANTAFYRVSPTRVDNVDRAVGLLGTEGIRRLMATAIMQPVFRTPKGPFDSFAPTTWDFAQRSAVAVDAYSQGRLHYDHLVAQLLAVIGPLARIVTFRLTMDAYGKSPQATPRAEVFIRAVQRFAPQIALLIAQSWELSELSLTALREQAERVSPTAMGHLGRAIYYANLAASLALVASLNSKATESLQTALREQGLTRLEAELLWDAAAAPSEAD